MKWIIAGLLLLQSCGAPDLTNGISNDLQIHPDAAHGVICYTFTTSDNISCVQTNTIGK